MVKFIELKVEDEGEVKPQLINTDCIGRVYPNPQNSRKCIVELSYHSINEAPVFLEVDMPYENVRAYLTS